ncbi:MAG: hypothetical protein AAF384_19645 [Pseudomonadota bacterium]
MKRITTICLALFFMAVAPVYAATVTLDNTNGYSVDIEPGVTLTRPGLNVGGPLFITGGEFAIGTTDVAVFPGQTQLGGAGFRLGGFRPRDLATGLPIGSGPIPFSIKATATGNLYDALLIFWSGEMLWGSPPLPLEETFPGSGVFVAANAAGAVLDLQLAAPVPLPAASYLLLAGVLGLLRIARPSA